MDGLFHRAVSFTILGQPVAKGRPKFVRSRGGFPIAHTPTKTRNWENLVREEFIIMAKEKRIDLPIQEAGAIELHVSAFFKAPTAWPKWKKKLAMAEKVYHLVRPDGDNVCKGICDALNGLAWRDDSQVAIWKVAKFYSDKPRCEVWIGYQPELTRNNIE